MEIPLCHMISVQVMRLAFTNDILKLKEDFYLGYHFGVVVFYVSLQGID